MHDHFHHSEILLHINMQHYHLVVDTTAPTVMLYTDDHHRSSRSQSFPEPTDLAARMLGRSFRLDNLLGKTIVETCNTCMQSKSSVSRITGQNILLLNTVKLSPRKKMAIMPQNQHVQWYVLLLYLGFITSPALIASCARYMYKFTPCQQHNQFIFLRIMTKNI